MRDALNPDSTPEPSRPGFVLHLITRGPDGQPTRQHLLITSGVLVLCTTTAQQIPPELLDRTIPLDLSGGAKEGT